MRATRAALSACRSRSRICARGVARRLRRARHSRPGLSHRLRARRGILDGILGRLDIANWETEDLLLMLVLYLMYRESGDSELLIILAAMLFL